MPLLALLMLLHPAPQTTPAAPAPPEHATIADRDARPDAAGRVPAVLLGRPQGTVAARDLAVRRGVSLRRGARRRGGASRGLARPRAIRRARRLPLRALRPARAPRPAPDDAHERRGRPRAGARRRRVVPDLRARLDADRGRGRRPRPRGRDGVSSRGLRGPADPAGVARRRLEAGRRALRDPLRPHGRLPPQHGNRGRADLRLRRPAAGGRRGASRRAHHEPARAPQFLEDAGAGIPHAALRPARRDHLGAPRRSRGAASPSRSRNT